MSKAEIPTTTRIQGSTLSAGVRLVILGVMAAVLLLISLLIFILVDDRIENSNKAISSIVEPWGGDQVVGAPVILIPYQAVQDGRSYYRTFAFLPDSLSVRAALDPEIRKRSIYSALIYRADVDIEATFAAFDERSFPMTTKQIFWDQAYIQFGVSDIIGLKSYADCEIDGERYRLSQVASFDDDPLSFPSHLIAPLKTIPQNGFSMSMKLKINGSQSIRFLPLGNVSDVDLKMNWGNPSFVGRFLPDQRSVSDSVSSAHWRVLAINRSLPPTYVMEVDLSKGVPISAGRKYHKGYYSSPNSDLSFGAKLLLAGDHYSLVNRSVKYAILIIVFTFLSIFFSDAFSKRSIPIIAYLLVGVAILLFYSLLLSISEYLGFTSAYIISSVAIIALMTVYMYGYFRDMRYVSFCGGVLVLLYALLYLLLNLAMFPLLIGSIFLFVMLAVVMYLSQRMEWR